MGVYPGHSAYALAGGPVTVCCWISIINSHFPHQVQRGCWRDHGTYVGKFLGFRNRETWIISQLCHSFALFLCLPALRSVFPSLKQIVRRSKMQSWVEKLYVKDSWLGVSDVTSTVKHSAGHACGGLLGNRNRLLFYVHVSQHSSYNPLTFRTTVNASSTAEAPSCSNLCERHLLGVCVTPAATCSCPAHVASCHDAMFCTCISRALLHFPSSLHKSYS